MAKYSVTFQPMNVTIEVEPSEFPCGGEGEPGSLLDIALAHGVMVEHACGGACACGTCHVIITAGAENLSKPREDELDIVEQVLGNTPQSRLACQAVVKGDVVCRLP